MIFFKKISLCLHYAKLSESALNLALSLSVREEKREREEGLERKLKYSILLLPSKLQRREREERGEWERREREEKGERREREREERENGERREERERKERGE